MKKFLIGTYIVIVLLILLGCSDIEEKYETSFIGTVLENNETSLLVEPKEGSDELRSADKISVNIRDADLLNEQDEEITIDEIEVGDEVKIYYGGEIAESYPAQITSDEIILLD